MAHGLLSHFVCVLLPLSLAGNSQDSTLLLPTILLGLALLPSYWSVSSSLTSENNTYLQCTEIVPQQDTVHGKSLCQWGVCLGHLTSPPGSKKRLEMGPSCKTPGPPANDPLPPPRITAGIQCWNTCPSREYFTFNPPDGEWLTAGMEFPGMGA